MNALAFSPDGNSLVAAGGLDGLRVYDVNSGQIVKSGFGMRGIGRWITNNGHNVEMWTAP